MHLWMMRGISHWEILPKFFAHPEAINTFVYSIGVAIITTVVCILLGYPAAYILTQMRMKYASTVVVLFILPMWVNILIRTLATVALFDFMNVSLGEGALIFGMVYNFLPFMIYPIYNTLQKLDKSYVEAAQDLGAKSHASVFQGCVAPVYAGYCEWYINGIYAYYLHIWLLPNY